MMMMMIKKMMLMSAITKTRTNVVMKTLLSSKSTML